MSVPVGHARSFRTRSKVLAWISLGLCVVAVLLWIRSYWHWDTFLHASARGTYVYVDSHQGGMSFATKSDCPVYQRSLWSSTSKLRTNPLFNAPETIVQPDGTRWTRFYIYVNGETFRSWSSNDPSVFFPSQLDVEFGVPHWIVALIFAIAPCVAAFFILRQWRRKRLGLCLNCGAEVHAIVERCPECGILRSPPVNADAVTENSGKASDG
jgi:hypothetical protein